MCKPYDYSYLWLDGKLKAIDRCIALFVLQLNQFGIKTINSCCGHEKRYPNVICVPGTEEKLKEFGCEIFVTREDGRVEAYFPVHSCSGKVFIEDSI